MSNFVRIRWGKSNVNFMIFAKQELPKLEAVFGTITDPRHDKPYSDTTYPRHDKH